MRLFCWLGLHRDVSIEDSDCRRVIAAIRPYLMLSALFQSYVCLACGRIEERRMPFGFRAKKVEKADAA